MQIDIEQIRFAGARAHHVGSQSLSLNVFPAFALIMTVLFAHVRIGTRSRNSTRLNRETLVVAASTVDESPYSASILLRLRRDTPAHSPRRYRSPDRVRCRSCLRRDANVDLTLGVVARGDRFDVVVLERRFDAGRGVDRLEERVDRAIAFGVADDACHRRDQAQHFGGAGSPLAISTFHWRQRVGIVLRP